MEIKTAVHFWMTNRAEDCEKLLEGLGVEKKKVLNCCTHVALGIDFIHRLKFLRYSNQDMCAEVTGYICWTKTLLTIFLSPQTSTYCISKVAVL